MMRFPNWHSPCRLARHYLAQAWFLLGAGMLVAQGCAGLNPAQARALPPVARAGAPLTAVASFGDDFRLVGIAVTPDGRIFASAPANNVRSRYSVVEVDRKHGALTPYPTAQWNHFSTTPGQSPQWINAQALWADDAGHLWVLDSSLPALNQHQLPPKLVEIDTRDDHVLRQYELGHVVSPPDALNDVRIDLKAGYAYLTNAGNQGSLVVLNLASGTARQVLIGDRSTRSDPAQHFMVDGQIARKLNGQELVLHADGIALSPDGAWLYYRPLSDHHYWRVPTQALRDPTLDAKALSATVQYLGDTVASGGLIMDPNGTLIGGDLEHRTIVAITQAGTPPGLQTTLLASDPRLSWADGFAISQGNLYVADSRLWEVVLQNGFTRSGRFTLYKMPLPKPQSR